MQPNAMAVLQQAAVLGPIVILITTKSICFALIVTLSSKVQYLELPKFILPEANVLAGLSRGLANPTFDFETFVQTFEDEDHTIRSDLLAGREGTIRLVPDDVPRRLLTDLWKNIAKPVFDALGLQASTPFFRVIIHLISM
jgi:hypothetical protein